MNKKLDIKTIRNTLDIIREVHECINKLEKIKSIISTTKAATIKNEDIIDYRLCDLFIPTLNKYIIQFDSITNEQEYQDVYTWFLEKHYTYQTIKQFINEEEKKYKTI